MLDKVSSVVKALLLKLTYLQWLLPKFAPLCCRDIHFKEPALNTDFRGSCVLNTSQDWTSNTYLWELSIIHSINETGCNVNYRMNLAMA